MSPSEADLRAALREGEGDGVDANDIIWSVRHTRARRRSMLLSAAAAVIVVAATAAGVTALVHGAGSPNGASGAAAQGNGNGGGTAAAGSSSTSVPARTHPQPALPGGGAREPGMEIAPRCGVLGGPASPGRARASGSLVPGPVREFFVCAYSNFPPPSPAMPPHVRITGPAARQIAESLRKLTANSMPPDCPEVSSSGNTAINLLPISPTGRQLPDITVKIGLPACATTVTNGPITRYGWRLPPSVKALLPRPGEPGTFQLVPPARGESGAPPR